MAESISKYLPGKSSWNDLQQKFSPDNPSSHLHFQLPSVRVYYPEILIDQKQEALNVLQGQILTLLMFTVLLYAAENFWSSEEEHFNYS